MHKKYKKRNTSLTLFIKAHHFELLKWNENIKKEYIFLSPPSNRSTSNSLKLMLIFFSLSYFFPQSSFKYLSKNVFIDILYGENEKKKINDLLDSEIYSKSFRFKSSFFFLFLYFCFLLMCLFVCLAGRWQHTITTTSVSYEDINNNNEWRDYYNTREEKKIKHEN